MGSNAAKLALARHNAVDGLARAVRKIAGLWRKMESYCGSVPRWSFVCLSLRERFPAMNVSFRGAKGDITSGFRSGRRHSKIVGPLVSIEPDFADVGCFAGLDCRLGVVSEHPSLEGPVRFDR
jgi:hypothetical protein